MLQQHNVYTIQPLHTTEWGKCDLGDGGMGVGIRQAGLGDFHSHQSLRKKYPVNNRGGPDWFMQTGTKL